MAANIEKSCRGTAWDRWFTDPAFRRGFADRKANQPSCPEYDQRSIAWQYAYEDGRLFAASRRSSRWSKMPAERRDVSRALLRAYQLSTRPDSEAP